MALNYPITALGVAAPLAVRPATTADRTAISALLLHDAKVRARLNPGLWSIPADAARRLEASLATIESLGNGAVRHHWTVAERGGRVIAVTHAINLPVPPVYDQGEGNVGIILDDSHFSQDEAASAFLLARTEQVLFDNGARLTVAASPVRWTSRTRFLKASGYEPTTYFMTRSGLKGAESSELIRPANTDDVPEIGRLAAEHRARLAIANPAFWRIHPEATARFSKWMLQSLSLPDREIFVSGNSSHLDGFIVAQPGSPVNLLPPHDLSAVGFIDDFVSEGFGASRNSAEAARASALLKRAEDHFHTKGIDTVLLVCPVKLKDKLEFLTSSGYAPANLWAVKVRTDFKV